MCPNTIYANVSSIEPGDTKVFGQTSVVASQCLMKLPFKTKPVHVHDCSAPYKLHIDWNQYGLNLRILCYDLDFIVFTYKLNKTMWLDSNKNNC